MIDDSNDTAHWIQIEYINIIMTYYTYSRAVPTWPLVFFYVTLWLGIYLPIQINKLINYKEKNRVFFKKSMKILFSFYL